MSIRKPAEGDKSEVDDADFAVGKYNVYVFCNLPADRLTLKQHRLLVEAVKKGAGFIMLGGHYSFGPGGWADTPLAEVLPCAIHPGDGEIEEPTKLVPTRTGLDSFILQVGATEAETTKIWDSMPAMLGTNRFGELKAGASVLATTARIRAGHDEPGNRRRPSDRLRRRDLGLGSPDRGRAAGPPQVLETVDFLALTQGG